MILEPVTEADGKGLITLCGLWVNAMISNVICLAHSQCMDSMLSILDALSSGPKFEQ